jgi:penicillin amidase
MRRRMLLGIGIALGALILLLLAGGALAFYRASRQPFPQTRGTLRLPGLQAPVTVIRDRWGVPHIYASNLHDLFMAQGFVHAQDRFWQMEFWRHIGTGRLSEMLGKTTLNQDRFIRTLGWNRAARQDLERLGPEERAILEAYTAGVNAYLEQHRDRLPLEFTLFRLFGRRWEIEPWQPLHTVAWAKVMAWDLGGNWDDELLNARIVDRIGAERLKEIVLPYPADRPVIVPTPVAEVPEETLRALLDIGRSLQRMTLGDAPDIGSNNWVVAGSRTVTGKPLLANDPHLSIQMPSIWYEVALHCEPVTPECPLRVAGASFPGVPGIVIGHNDRIAWGVTNVGPDVQDLYLERANPQNPLEVEFQGKWEPVRVITEEIRIAGQPEPLLLPVRITRHGPVINDVVEALTRTQTLYAFRWTALEPSSIVQALLRLNRARNWEEFRAALADWDVPGQNFVYADVDGHIGYQATGRIPIRAKGNGLLPVPGWTGEYEWTGYVPYEEMPRRLDPPEGFIVTANNAVVDPAYPYFLAAVWDYGDRAQRITDLLRAKDRLSIEDMAAIQNDTFSLAAQAITPYILQVSFTDPLARQAQDLLRAWDFRATPESPAPTIFEAFLQHLLHEAWVDELGEEIVQELLTGAATTDTGPAGRWPSRTWHGGTISARHNGRPATTSCGGPSSRPWPSCAGASARIPAPGPGGRSTRPPSSTGPWDNPVLGRSRPSSTAAPTRPRDQRGGEQHRVQRPERVRRPQPALPPLHRLHRQLVRQPLHPHHRPVRAALSSPLRRLHPAVAEGGVSPDALVPGGGGAECGGRPHPAAVASAWGGSHARADHRRDRIAGPGAGGAPLSGWLRGDRALAAAGAGAPAAGRAGGALGRAHPGGMGASG